MLQQQILGQLISTINFIVYNQQSNTIVRSACVICLKDQEAQARIQRACFFPSFFILQIEYNVNERCFGVEYHFYIHLLIHILIN